MNFLPLIFFEPKFSIGSTTLDPILFHYDNSTQIHLRKYIQPHPNFPNINYYQTISHYVQWSPNGPLQKYH
jgi:hypothetical protein